MLVVRGGCNVFGKLGWGHGIGGGVDWQREKGKRQ